MNLYLWVFMFNAYLSPDGIFERRIYDSQISLNNPRQLCYQSVHEKWKENTTYHV